MRRLASLPHVLALLLIAGCRGAEPAAQTKLAPGQAPDASAAKAADTTIREVAVTVDPPPGPGNGAIAMIGFGRDQLDGDWPRLGQAPRHHAVSDPLTLGPTLTARIGLVGDLTYIAILDLNDDGRPGPGELTSKPVHVPSTGAVPAFIVSHPYVPPETGPDEPDEGPGLRSPTDEGASGGQEGTLVLETRIKPPFLREGRILVVGLPASEGAWRGPLERTPSFLWRSPKLPLRWPVEVEARFPTEGDLVVVLDLDGAGEPSLGDLVSEPVRGFRAPADGGPVQVTLTGPLTEPDEGGD